MSARFEPAIDARIAAILRGFEPSFDASSPEATDLVISALQSRHKEYRSKPPAPFARIVQAALQRVTSKAAAAAAELEAAPPTPDDGGADETPGVVTVRAASLNSSLYVPTPDAASDSKANGAGASAAGTKRRRAEPGPAAARLRRLGQDGGGELAGGGGMGAGGLAPVDGGFVLLPCVRPWERFSDLGGVRPLLRTLRELVEYPLVHPELYAHLGIDPPTGILLYGSSGCGKTRLARAIGGELGVYFRQVSGPETVGGVSGESEQRLRMIFDDAVANAPAIIFIDDVDAIAPRRDASAARGMERRMVATLLACLDGLSQARTSGKHVLVIAATNRPESLDSGLRRAGRLDRELVLPVPDEESRVEILKVVTARMRLGSGSRGGSATPEGGDAPLARSGESGIVTSGFDYRAIARATPGYVGADIVALAKEAAVCAVNRAFAQLFSAGDAPPAVTVAADSVGDTGVAPYADGGRSSRDDVAAWQRSTDALRATAPLTPEQMAGLCVSFDDFMAALPKVQPAATREGFATIPNVTWADVGALAKVRGDLEMAIVQPLLDPGLFARYGVSNAGVLLYGPPGCGKTLLAKAIAHETSANFISVKGPELLDKYVGESERAVRQVFARAATSAPCIIFFDELDALAPRRGGPGGGSSGNNVTERVVNQLLTELDGLEERRDVFVVAATNRPDIIDPAMLRPGRLDKLIYVPLPTREERALILATHARRMPLAADVDIEAVASSPRCERFSGADLAGLAREAAVTALRELLVDRGATSLGSEARMRPAPGAAEDGPAAPPPTTAAPAPVHQRHFLAALARTAPSVSLADERRYNALRGRMEQARFSLAADAPAAAAAGVEGGPSPGEADAAGPGGAVAGPGVA